MRIQAFDVYVCVQVHLPILFSSRPTIHPTASPNSRQPTDYPCSIRSSNFRKVSLLPATTS